VRNSASGTEDQRQRQQRTRSGSWNIAAAPDTCPILHPQRVADASAQPPLYLPDGCGIRLPTVRHHHKLLQISRRISFCGVAGSSPAINAKLSVTLLNLRVLDRIE
jgi:hypothetical protein